VWIAPGELGHRALEGDWGPREVVDRDDAMVGAERSVAGPCADEEDGEQPQSAALPRFRP
jgi:hypothetical protein